METLFKTGFMLLALGGAFIVIGTNSGKTVGCGLFLGGLVSLALSFALTVREEREAKRRRGESVAQPKRSTIVLLVLASITVVASAGWFAFYYYYPNTIEWQDASRYANRTVRFEAPIMNIKAMDSHVSGMPTFLDIGSAYPDPNRVTIMWWGKDSHEFWAGDSYLNRRVVVTGKVTEYGGATQLVLDKASQLQLLDRE